MSSADFPGSSWQDEPGLPDGLGRRSRTEAGYGTRAAQNRGSDWQQPRRAAHAGRFGRRQGADWPQDNGNGNGWRLAASRTAEGYRGGSGNGRSTGRVAGAGRPAGQTMPVRRGGSPGGSRGGSGWDGGDGFYRPGRNRGGAQRPSHWPWRASWWKHWTIKKVALLLGGTVALVVLLAVGAFLVAYASVQVPLSALSKPLDQSSVVYFAGGRKVVGTFSSQNRTLLTQAQVAQAKNLTAAVLAAEDRRFETEGGISITSTVRAAVVDISGSGFQGASTITEQLVKNYFDPGGTGNLTYKSKIKEIIVAIKLAKIRSKSWILTNYLNTIYLGSGAYGVQAAAETYFGRPAWDLNVAQSAMIAAMINQPGLFDPQGTGVWHNALVSRWRYVLGNMVGDGAITQRQASEQQFPKVLKAPTTDSWSGFRGYIMAAVKQELQNTYGITPSQLADGGYRIVTTVSLPRMRLLYDAVAQVKRMMAASGYPFPDYAHIGALLEQPGTGKILAWYGGPNFEAKPKRCKLILCQYDMAMQSRNQVGSSFKPYVLAEAVAQGMNVETSKLFGDSPACIPPDSSTYPGDSNLLSIPGGNGISCPNNPGYLAVSLDPVVQGPVSVQKAAALSSNPAFEDLAHKVGTKSIIALAGQLGVNITPAAPNGNGSGLQDDVGKVGIALGIAPLTVEEQASTFATFANIRTPGDYVTPHVIGWISQGSQNIHPKVLFRPVFNAQQISDINWALSADTVYGTGTPNAVLSPARPTIAKTGTTNAGQSAFFIGATPGQYSFAVGMFTNVQDNVIGHQSLHSLPYIGGWQGQYGGAWPATLWRIYMSDLYARWTMPIAPLALPDTSNQLAWIQLVQAPKHKHKHCQLAPNFPCPGGGPNPPPPNPNPTPPTAGQPGVKPSNPARGRSG